MNNFFGSKLNTVLLLILIILMIIAIKIMLKDKETYLPMIDNKSEQILGNKEDGQAQEKSEEVVKKPSLQKSNEAAIKDSLLGFHARAELFFSDSQSNSYSGVCYLPELKTVWENIKNAGGTDFVCRESDTAWAVGVKLPPNSSSKYWCVDSYGYGGAEIPSSSTFCPVGWDYKTW